MSTYEPFDQIASRELRQPISLYDLCRENIGWYTDKAIADSHLDDWGLNGLSGLYFLWHKEDYCSVHHRFHMRALYVGKGALPARLKAHWLKKPTEELMLIYFSYVVLANRMAKYIEQLILDCYNLPFNQAENLGELSLCAHFEQAEVD
ncbi:hypothetical protein [Pontixanthobacter luteolus]|uniref:hypothetical protein n=1 Tax=Pontixanthobacter luteolus TaxID=295089 RepID=UPI002303C73D|nr:hypothetical protein [Pontixanthobacter luteolus]